MVSTANRRSIMTLYSGNNKDAHSHEDAHSHRVRIVLAEKGVSYEVVDVHSSSKAMEELREYNASGIVPTLVDRDLVLYQSEIIMEYLDERFPHPPLMPVYPVAKGRSRLMIHRVNLDWYSLMDKILAATTPAEADLARKQLADSITSVAPVFAEMPFFLSEEFSLVDCCIAPLLWRLPKIGVKLPPQAEQVLVYANKIFKRESFQASLSEPDRMMKL